MSYFENKMTQLGINGFSRTTPYINLNEEITLVHDKCGCKFSVKPILFFRNVEKCPSCDKGLLKKIKISNTKDRLDKKLAESGEFKRVSEYLGYDKKIEILHKTCNRKFKTTFTKFSNVSKYKCPLCTKDEDRKKRQELFDKRLDEECNGEYKRVSLYKGYKKAVTLVHKKCNTKINVVPATFFQTVHEKKCSNCTVKIKLPNSQEEKNIYFQNLLDEKCNKEYILTTDYTNIVSSVNVRHIKCGTEFEILPRTFFTTVHKCPVCNPQKNIYNGTQSIKEKFYEYEKRKNFEYKILGYTSNEMVDIEIEHVKCGHVFTRNIKSFLQGNKKYSQCPACRKLEELEEFNKKLKLKYDEEFEIDGEYKGIATPTMFRHNMCGASFKIQPKKLLERKTPGCPVCDKTRNFKKKLFDKFKGEYTLIEECEGSLEDIRVRHKICGKAFKTTKRGILKASTPCPDCLKKRKALGIEEFQNRINKQFGKLFTVAGIYKNQETKMPITCNACKNIFMMEPKRLISPKGCKKCPLCGVKHL